MNKWNVRSGILAFLWLVAFITSPLLTDHVLAKTSLKTAAIQIPFVANSGQIDERVRFYANTFGGTVFVTKDGEIVYALPSNNNNVETHCRASLPGGAPLRGLDDGIGGANGRSPSAESGRTSVPLVNVEQVAGNKSGSFVNWGLFIDGFTSFNPSYIYNGGDAGWVKRSAPITTSQSAIRNGVALKETIVGGRILGIKGEGKSVTKVSCFKGSDPAKWNIGVSTFEMVDLGEVYDGIDLRLKAYGNNVEKLFFVKPGADPGVIRVSLSGIQPDGNPPPTPAGGGQSSVFFNEGDASLCGGCPKSAKIKFNMLPVAAIHELPLQIVCRNWFYKLFGQPHEGGCNSHASRETSRHDVSCIRVNEEGELEVETALGPVKFTRPVAYQIIDGKRVDVVVSYSIQESGVGSSESGLINPRSEIANSNPKSKIVNRKLAYGFRVAAYDKTRELIIDPLLASTYIGGSDSDYAYAAAIDSDGNIYICGHTYSSDFPTTDGVYDTASNDSYDVFISKLSGDLATLYASTYLGGSSDDYSFSTSLDSDGNIYVTGHTKSSDFPTTSDTYDTSYDATFDNGSSDVFVSKLNGDLTSLLASTYLGGSSYDYGRSIITDSGGNIFVTGYTQSSDFPTTTGAYNTSKSGAYDLFVSRLSSDLTTLNASTFLGGASFDYGLSAAINSDGNIYITGYTYSSDFPTTTGAYDTSYESGEAFVSKLNGDLTSLTASTYLGGSSYDYGFSAAIDPNGNIFVTGNTESSDFATTAGVYNTSYNGYGDLFVSKLDGDLATLAASTYLGGTSYDYGYSTAIDSGGNVYVTGYTQSSDFPTTSDAYDTSGNDGYDAFASKLSGDLTTLYASTYLGGSSDDYSCSVIIDSSENVYLAGYTYSSDFPVTSGAYYTYSSSYYDAFVARLDGNLSVSTVTPTPVPSPTPTSGTGKISGYVYKESKDTVFEGVNVTLTDNSSANTSSTTTDAEGYFEFLDVSEGDYTLTFEKEGYETQTVDISLSSNTNRNVNIIMEVIVGRIYGYVKESGGGPIENAEVKLKKSGKIEETSFTSTDTDGYYEFDDLDEGRYKISVKKKGYERNSKKTKLETSQEKEINFKLKKR